MDPVGHGPRLAAQFIGGAFAAAALGRAPAPGPAPGPVAAPLAAPLDGIDPARAPGPALALAPGNVPIAELAPPEAPHLGPFHLENPFEAHDKWLIPVIVVVAVGVFAGFLLAACRRVRQLGVPIRD